MEETPHSHNCSCLKRTELRRVNDRLQLRSWCLKVKRHVHVFSVRLKASFDASELHFLWSSSSSCEDSSTRQAASRVFVCRRSAPLKLTDDRKWENDFLRPFEGPQRCIQSPQTASFLFLLMLTMDTHNFLQVLKIKNKKQKFQQEFKTCQSIFSGRYWSKSDEGSRPKDVSLILLEDSFQNVLI